MIQTIRFFAHGVPKGQPRPKAFSRGGIASVYDPGTAEGWKGQVALAARPFIPASPLDMPLSVVLIFYFPRPKSHYSTGRKALEMRSNAPRWHTKKPDCDNLEKAVLDALTLLRMWTDDCIVCDQQTYKFYAPCMGSSEPGCAIEIKEA